MMYPVTPRGRLVSQALFAAALRVVAPAAFAQTVPAFSGADGAGAYATGGRGGVVYHVTRLDGEINGNRTVAGTLAYGLSDANFKDGGGNVIPRTIVFDVGGTIFLGQKNATEGWDTQDPLSAGSNITIAGQTAPGGINLVGGGLKANGNNAIIRNLNIAPGYGARKLSSVTGYAESYVYDGMNIHATNVIVDHVSTVFATDEGISLDEFANNVSVQYCNISQGQNYPQADAENPGVYTGHALGSLDQPGSNAKISIIHNLYAQEKGRLPRVGTEASKLTVAGVGAFNDFRNNVFYNWYDTAGTGASAQPSQNNFVNNFFLAGPGGDDNSGTLIVSKAGGTTIFNGNSGPTGVYQSGNLKDLNKDGDANDGVLTTASDFSNSVIQSAAYWQVPYYGPTESATDAYSRVLNYVGANWNSRDAIDSRIVNETRTGTGKITAFNDPTHGTEWNALLALRQVNGVAPYNRAVTFDTDRDGMPDVWEIAHGLNPTVADNNGDYDSNGFTNLEEYLDEISPLPAPAPIVFGNGNANGRYAQIGNWTSGVFQPTRYDEAQINSGTAIVDAVGQHAGTLKIAATAASVATLSVTGGWIDVAKDLYVGPAGTGAVNQTGGIVHAGRSVLIGAGTGLSQYTLTAGTLSTPLLARNSGTGTFSFVGGTLHADMVNFSLVNAGGILAPGSDGAVEAIGAAEFADADGVQPSVQGNLGDTHVFGSLTFLPASTLQIELLGTANGAFDTITVDNLLTIGGTLDVETLGGFLPNNGDRFLIGTASSGIAGSFAQISPNYFVQTVGTNLYLVATPEPSLGLASIACVAAMANRRKRMR